jgi:hypothetical protein
MGLGLSERCGLGPFVAIVKFNLVKCAKPHNIDAMSKVATIKKIPSTLNRHGQFVGSFTVKNRGTVVVSPKSMQSLERFGARYSTALKSLAKR